jgi:hypothetical protein
VRTYLLDANVVIALVVAEHEHHERVVRWAAGRRQFALCPVVEGALVRYLVRLGESIRTARSVLASIHALPNVAFWPDGVSYTEVDLDQVRGHRQITDSYLVGLAAHNDGRLATLDVGLAHAHPRLAVLIPPVPVGSPRSPR